MQAPGGWRGASSWRMEGCKLLEDGGVQAPGGWRGASFWRMEGCKLLVDGGVQAPGGWRGASSWRAASGHHGLCSEFMYVK